MDAAKNFSYAIFSYHLAFTKECNDAQLREKILYHPTIKMYRSHVSTIVPEREIVMEFRILPDRENEFMPDLVYIDQEIMDIIRLSGWHYLGRG